MNLDGWEIDVDSLPGPKRGESPALYVTDAIFPSPDGTHAVVLYTITEIRLGWDVGMLALFANRDNPTLVLNPERFLCCYTEDSIIWLSNDLFAAKKHYYDSTKNRLNVPFALVDLANNRYSFIPLANSYPYGLSSEGAGIRLIERQRDERFPSHDGKCHSIDELLWYDLSQLNDFDSQYAKHAA